MRVLVLGASGMLGHKVHQVCRQQFDTWAGGRRLLGLDATHWSTVEDGITLAKPDAIVNCIGVVPQTLPKLETMVAVNAVFPLRLAMLCRERGIRLIHISTDCVFSGLRGNYSEADLPDAEDVYGMTKFAGEPPPPCLTLRTSLIGPQLVGRYSLLEWFIAQRGSCVPGYTNVWFSGFTTLAFARIVADILASEEWLSGLYHVSSPTITKYKLLCLVNAMYDLNITVEAACATQSDRSLDSNRFRDATGFQPPSWRKMIEEMQTDTANGGSSDT
tara:strand:+ start:1094 stop:1915 length:822 start_codon:yes stop_codon:yes gene_type:complete